MPATVDTRFFRAAVIYALIGMAVGIHMAASHDHALAPAHAHWLLLGWVSMFLYGAFYKLFPAAQGKLAAWHWWIANLGVIVMVAGIALIVTGTPARGEPLAGIGSLINISGMALFAVNVFRGVRA
jgi:cbb3-type cytochrome oxidase subunit 1